MRRQADFLAKASKLSDYPLTTDPSFGNRTVWSEAKIQRFPGSPNPTTIPVGENTPFHANYMCTHNRAFPSALASRI